MEVMKKISLWVNNMVFRWKASAYQNKFVDTQLFICHEMEKEDRNIILHLFNLDELDLAIKEKGMAKYLEDAEKEHDEEFKEYNLNVEALTTIHLSSGCGICKRRKYPDD